MIFIDTFFLWVFIICLFLLFSSLIIFIIYLWKENMKLSELIKKYNLPVRVVHEDGHKLNLLEFKSESPELKEKKRKNRERVKRWREKKRTLETNQASEKE